MKKKYVEPEIFFESFELNSNVAGGCELLVGFSEDNCSVEIPGWGNVFVSNPACDATAPEDNDSVCYHNPSAPFSS